MPKIVDTAKMREDILGATQHVFAQKGLHATRMIDIANEMNIVKGTLYRYFDTKDAVITALVKQQVLQLENTYQTGVNQIETTADLLARLDWVMTVGREAAPSIRMFFELLQPSLDLGAAREIVQEFFARLGCHGRWARRTKCAASTGRGGMERYRIE
jgi:AcrR family transcriptional regulator